MRDYKDAAWVVDMYNGCVEAGDDYLKAKELDDTRNMPIALQRFGVELGRVSEIVVRHIIYKQYNYENDDESCSFNDLWRELFKDGGSLIPQLRQLGFTCDTSRKDTIARKEIRTKLSNGPKHQGTVACNQDWGDFLQVYEELRKLVSNFVVGPKTGPMRTFHTRASLSDVQEWENLYNSAYGFRKESGYKYILITDRFRHPSFLDLFKIPWSIVLDFDPESDQTNGMWYTLQHTPNDYHMEKYSISDKPNANSTAIHWVNMALKDEYDECYKDKPLARKIANKFSSFMEAYHRQYSDPVIVVVSMNSERYHIALKRTAQVIYEKYDNDNAANGSDARFLVLRNSSIELLLEDDALVENFDLNIQQMIAGIRKEIADKPVFTGQYLMPGKNESGNCYIELTSEQCHKLRQYAEPVYYGIEQEQNEDSLAKPEEFYRGYTHATWKMIAEGSVVMKPAVLAKWQEKLEECLSKPGTPRFWLSYQRGMGGTTALRLLAFAMHEKYPTIIVHSYVKTYTAAEIVKLYTLCNMPLLILIDSNNLYAEEIAKLREELAVRTFSFVMVCLSGYMDYIRNGSNLSLSEFPECDRTNIVKALKNNLNTEPLATKLTQLDINDLAANFGKEFSPFLLSMHIFEDDFPSIRTFVENTLRFTDLPVRERNTITTLENILFAIALAGWAGFPVDEQSFFSMDNQSLISRIKRADSPLAPLITYNVANHGVQNVFQLRHYQFGPYILARFSNKEGNSIRFTGIVDRIVQFIKDSRGTPSRPENEKTIRLLRRLFINRDWDSTDFLSGNVQNQKVYSLLICKIIEEHKAERRSSDVNDAYNPETDGILKIYSALTKYYPDELHFHAHLARYYFYTAHDYENGIKAINRALAIAEDRQDSNSTDVALAYHIKGMGYRSRIYNVHIHAIRKIQSQLQESRIDKKEAIRQIRKSFADLTRDLKYADDNFEQSEVCGGDNAVYALISSCQMHIEVQKLFLELEKDTARYGMPSVVDQEMILRNADLLQAKNDELQACYYFFDDEFYQHQDTGRGNKLKNHTLVQDINVDVISLTHLHEDAIAFCRQCLGDSSIAEKSHYRHLVAQMELEGIRDNIRTKENQRKLQEIIDLYEDNIAENPGSGVDVRSWFNAVRQLECDYETAIELLISCQSKLDRWIDCGNASRDAYLYRFIVRFLLDYENNSLESSESRRALKQMEDDIKRHAEMLPTKTQAVFWLGNEGNGLNRLISNAEFGRIPSQDKVVVLKMMEGKLPERSEFLKNAAYVILCGHKVFFRPNAVRGVVTASNSGAFVNFGMGFSYDGIRSYHDSIRLITKPLIKRERSSGESVSVRVYAHNQTWVECLIDEEDQPVIIHKDDLPRIFDPKNGNWPEKGEKIDNVVLMELRAYELRGAVFAEREITKQPFRGKCVS